MGKLKMSQKVIDALRQSVLRSNTALRNKLVLQELKKQWDDCGDCEPSGASVAKELGLGQKTVYAALKALVSKGEVTVIDGSHTRYYPTEYYEEATRDFKP